jgi:hypothetical protein
MRYTIPEGRYRYKCLKTMKNKALKQVQATHSVEGAKVRL